MNKETIIQAHNLAAGYAGKSVWKQADFSIGKGDFVGVLGPNGAGKTTLFRLLLGLIKPLSGELSVFGQEPRRGNPRIGYVPQRHPVDSETMIEALEIVRLGLSGNRWGFDSPREARNGRDEALAAIESVGAKSLAHRPLGLLSGGEQQRVFLAQALVGNPDILLLDEPLANLDIRRESEMVELIQSIVKSLGVTVLLIVHNINPLLPVLNRVMYIANGRVATGNPGDVLNSQALSALYDSPVEVLRDSRGRIAIVGADEGAHHHDYHE
ncbi:MAG TPA: ABC transporter ATP-binding protein [Candidatus Paceibacterota bacterium]|nr:ABC transporter ATP-binding protein [Candidatus Paceibacterota bacterium]